MRVGDEFEGSSNHNQTPANLKNEILQLKGPQTIQLQLHSIS